ncbi:MAG: single-stranded-DNA-specific exonuclease RecJ [bacterium]|nr:single-stranded-DNA-specific exonuclease RecJ [bacterium]
MKTYKVREGVPEEIHQELAVYPEFLRELLFFRGLDNKEKAEIFLNPSYNDHTHDPLGILGMEKSVERILKAIKNNEVICIYSDYDHDGIPGGVILHDFFKKIGYANFINYIPHRYLEGYGLNAKAVETLAEEQKVTLLVTVDCGITDAEPVKRANELGIDVIISDHHLPNGKLPEAYAILNSKQENCDYAYDMLCGAAVAFKLVQALIARGNFSEKISPGWEKWLLDLVGLSTIGDMVPLTGENRVLAHYGLKVLRKSPRPGLLKLMRLMNMKQRFLTEDDVAFMLVPRINAASRMSDPRLAFNMLSASEEESEPLAKELHKLNDIRKGKVASMVKEMKHTLSQKDSIPPVIVMGNPHWQPGLLGLAAMNLVGEHNRPVFLWGREGGENLKGSCRSNGSANVMALMTEVRREIFTDFGGHAYSGGFAVSPLFIHELETELNRAYGKVRDETFEEVSYIDKKLSLEDVSMPTWRHLEKLAPFGVGNEKPLFLFENIVPEKTRMFGKTKEHLEITFRKTNGDFVRAIEFFSGREIKENEKISLVASMENSTFGQYPEIRLRIVDVL